MATTIYVTIKGKKQNKIDGDVKVKGRENTILGYSLDHTVEIPRDTHSGLPTGQRVHSPLTILTEFGKHTPKIFQACTTGEQLDVQLDFYNSDNKGQENKYFVIKLTNAIVSEAKAWFPETFIKENSTFHHMNTISFSYEKITWTHVTDSIEAEDSWSTGRGA